MAHEPQIKGSVGWLHSFFLKKSMCMWERGPLFFNLKREFFNWDLCQVHMMLNLDSYNLSEDKYAACGCCWSTLDIQDKTHEWHSVQCAIRCYTHFRLPPSLVTLFLIRFLAPWPMGEVLDCSHQSKHMVYLDAHQRLSVLLRLSR